MLFIIVLLAIIIVLVVANIKIVPQANAYVVERLGAYSATWGVGLHMKLTFIERVAKRVTLKEQVVDFPPSLLSQRITLPCRLTRLCTIR